MTTIQFGGGPTLEQRRLFAGLKEGSHVPQWVILILYDSWYSCYKWYVR